MNRVAVIGNAGGGKSALSRAMCERLKLPLHEIDKLLWQPGWVPTPYAVFVAQHQQIIARERWLLDGFGPWETVLERLEAAQVIVFVDLPIWRHYWWATKRQIKSAFVGRIDGPEGCPMLPMTFKLYKMMWIVHKKLRPKLICELRKHSQTKTVITLKSRQELDQFVDQHIK